MSHIRKNSVKVLGSIVGVTVMAAIAMWQFYLFATFRDAKGMLDLNGGIGHLWWAIVMTVLACIAGFFVFSVLVRHDTRNELHITS